jgi:hypothetical protein
MNSNDICSVYVTDYTKVQGSHPRSNNKQIPLALSEHTLKIEFFDIMGKVGQTMERGNVYRLENVFLKNSTGGWIEGTFDFRGKIRQMSLDAVDPHLQALLK